MEGGAGREQQLKKDPPAANRGSRRRARLNLSKGDTPIINATNNKRKKRRKGENKMTQQQIIEALTLTEENVNEFKEIFEERLADQSSVEEVLMRSFGNYDQCEGEGGFKSLNLFDKLIWITRYAMFNGYVRALYDVKEVQKLELEEGGNY